MDTARETERFSNERGWNDSDTSTQFGNEHARDYPRAAHHAIEHELGGTTRGQPSPKVCSLRALCIAAGLAVSLRRPLRDAALAADVLARRRAMAP